MDNRILQPPDSSATLFFIISSSNPTDRRLESIALASAPPNSFASSAMNLTTDALSVTSTSCRTNTHLIPVGNPAISPAAIRVNSVVFPAPLCPTTPYRAPRVNDKFVGRSSTLAAYARMIPLRSKINPSDVPTSSLVDVAFAIVAAVPSSRAHIARTSPSSIFSSSTGCTSSISASVVTARPSSAASSVASRSALATYSRTSSSTPARRMTPSHRASHAASSIASTRDA